VTVDERPFEALMENKICQNEFLNMLARIFKYSKMSPEMSGHEQECLENTPKLTLGFLD
jgi:hypothetical protein